LSDAPRSLRIAFEAEEEFCREYQSNIANGGIFIATNVDFDVREAVRVEISLGWCGERIMLSAEVVHVVSSELAGAGGTPGIALQFSAKTSDLRARFEPHLGSTGSYDERRAGTGRRAARRSTARVPVLIRDAAGVEYSAARAI
jgi:Tfp pilus assembly protein PilZ